MTDEIHLDIKSIANQDQWMDLSEYYKYVIREHIKQMISEHYDDSIDYKNDALNQQMRFRNAFYRSYACHEQYCHCDDCEYVKKHKSKHPSEFAWQSNNRDYLTHRVRLFKSLLP